jgi:hypothetical protein
MRLHADSLFLLCFSPSYAFCSPGITAACFSRTGARIALAQSYAWEHGNPADAAAMPAGARAATRGAPAVVVRKLTEAQVRLGAK